MTSPLFRRSLSTLLPMVALGLLSTGWTGFKRGSVNCEPTPVWRARYAGSGTVIANGDVVYVVGPGIRVIDDTSFEVAGGEAQDSLVEPDAPTAYEAAPGLGRLYALSYSTLYIWDTTDPLHPTNIGYVSGIRYPARLAVQGTVVAVAMGEAGVVLYDLADPASPQRLAEIVTPEPAKDVCFQGSKLLVAADDAGLLVYNVDDPRTPALKHSYPTEQAAIACVADDVLVYLGESRTGGLSILDFSDEYDPKLVATVPEVEYPSQLRRRGNLLLVRGIEIVSVADPIVPEYLGKMRGTIYGADSDMTAKRMYVASNGYTYVYEMNEAWPKGPVSRVPTFATNVTTEGLYGYASGYVGELLVADFSTVEEPKLASRTWDGEHGGQGNVAVWRETAYRSRSYPVRGIEIYDVGDRRSPVKVGFNTDFVSPSHIVVKDGFGYVSAGESTIGELDLADPLQPRLRATLSFGGNYNLRLDFDGRYLLATYGSYNAGTLQIVDATDPDALTSLGRYDYPKVVLGLSQFEDFLYLGMSDRRLRVLDATDPANPFEVGVQRLPDQVYDLLVADGILYAAVGSFGVMEFSLENPAAPLLAGMTFGRDTVFAIADLGEHILAADYDAGFSALKKLCVGSVTVGNEPFVDPTSLRVSDPWPNPFNGRMSVRLDLPERGRVRAYVIDASGRRVARLTDAWLAGGPQGIAWDGRTEDGRWVASGVYFLVVEVGDQRVARKIAYVK